MNDIRSQLESPVYWQGLSPNSTMTEHPWVSPVPPVVFSAEDIESAQNSLLTEGYFITRPCIDGDQLDRLTECISDVMSAGHRPGYALLFDEFFHILASLEHLLAGILGPDYLLVPDEPDIYFIPTSNDCGGSSPHRDTLRFRDMYDHRPLPKIVNIWIAVTDCTELNSCMHVIPAHQDPHYQTEKSLSDLPSTINTSMLQKCRALPVKAGSVLGWSTELIHWGGQSSAIAELPRLSAAMYFQRGDCRKFHPTATRPDQALPFEYRLYLVEKVLNDPDGNNLNQYLKQSNK